MGWSLDFPAGEESRAMTEQDHDSPKEHSRLRVMDLLWRPWSMSPHQRLQYTTHLRAH